VFILRAECLPTSLPNGLVLDNLKLNGLRAWVLNYAGIISSINNRASGA
jgi:hypothetical protein